MRYKCIVSYDGTAFHGFQTQIGLRTVQEEIETALKIMHKTDIKIHGAGRTDAGVHAVGQVFHFDSEIDILERNMKNAINTRLPKDIYIKEVYKVDDSFHAQYSAIKKEYHYIINLGEYDPLLRNYVYHPPVYRKTDIEKMIEVSKIFVGKHDFKSYAKRSEVATTVREIYSIDFERKDNILTIKFVGNGFLRNMVRILVAMLFEVGWNNYSENDLKFILEQKKRQLAPKIAPANGLYLFKVYYNDKNGLI